MFSAALVNKGCCLYRSGQYEKAVDFFKEALSVEATCSQALYNLGLVYKKLGRTQDALDTFTKLHTILKNSPEVMWHLGDVYDKVDDFDQATEWLVLSIVVLSSVYFLPRYWPTFSMSIALIVRIWEVKNAMLGQKLLPRQLPQLPQW